jgi:hypothetical protein
MLRIKKIFLFTIICILNYSAKSQENVADTESETHPLKHHRVSLIIGHGHVFGAETTSGGNLVTIPTWGIDYSYWINHNYGVGLKSDIEIINYVVESSEGEFIERDNPVIVSIIFLYHTRKGWNFLTGPGIEFEEHENLFIYRIGAGYEFHIANHWDFAPEIIFDIKEKGIGSFTWGIGVGKSF